MPWSCSRTSGYHKKRAATHPHKRTNRTNGTHSSHIPLHQAPTIAFSSLGYAILLEKPMAVTEEDCKAILDACVANKTILAVGHVLRYTPHVRTITDLIRTGYVAYTVYSRLDFSWRIHNSFPSLLTSTCFLRMEEECFGPKLPSFFPGTRTFCVRKIWQGIWGKAFFHRPKISRSRTFC
jgi:hypothetical protein